MSVMNKENIFSFATLTITYIYTYRIHFGFVCFHIIFTTFTFVYLVHLSPKAADMYTMYCE